MCEMGSPVRSSLVHRWGRHGSPEALRLVANRLFVQDRRRTRPVSAMSIKFVIGDVDTRPMALRRQITADDDPIEQLNRYSTLLGYEYALRREAGLEPRDAVRWSLRRVLPPPDGLHPAIALIAGYEADAAIWGEQASELLRVLMAGCEKSWTTMRNNEVWRPGTAGMGW